MVGRVHKITGYDKTKATRTLLVAIGGLKNLSLKDTKFGKTQMADSASGPPRLDPSQGYTVEYHATLFSN